MQAETRRGKRERHEAPITVVTGGAVDRDHGGELETIEEADDGVEAEPELEATDAVENDEQPEQPEARSTQAASRPVTVLRKAVPRARGPESSTVIKNLHRVEDQSVVEWIKTLQGSGPIQIRVHRLKPAMHNGKNVGGHLTTIDDQISEDELRDQYGGGTYQLRIMRRSANGSWVFLTSTSVVVAGDPRTDNLPKANPSEGTSTGQMQRADPDSNPLLERSFKFMEKQIELGGNKGPSPADMTAQMTMMMRPLELQMQQLMAQIASKDAQIAELLNKPQNPFQEKLLDKMIDGDTARVTAVREQLMSEIRVLRENAIADEKRLRDVFEREKEMIDRRNDREISNLKASHDQALSSIKMSFETQKTLLDGEIRRLERDLAETRVEVKELRAKKDKTIAETVKEMDTIKELFAKEDDDDDKDKSTIEKVADIAMNSDRLFDFASKWVGKGESKPTEQKQQHHQQQVEPPPRVIRRKADGQVMVRNDQTGKYEPVRRRRAADGTETDEVEAGVQISPEQIGFATQMLEMAYANKMKPEVVATTASTQIPEEILQAIRTHGVDGFLQKVAKLPSTSPLATQDGINWCRKLGKALVG